MSEDLYFEWLSVPIGERPPDHYALLGLAPLTDSRAEIDAAVADRLDRLDKYALHPDADKRAAVTRMMNEVAQARICLVNPQRKLKYDCELAAKLGLPPPAGSFLTPEAPAAGDEAASGANELLAFFERRVRVHLARRPLDAAEKRQLLAEAASLGIATQAALKLVRRVIGELPTAAPGPGRDRPFSRALTALRQSRQRTRYFAAAAAVLCLAIAILAFFRPKAGGPAAPPGIPSAITVTLQNTESAAPPQLILDLGDGVTMRLVLIPSGEFTMGSPPTEAGRSADEPQHQMRVNRAFYMGVCPVTRGQYRAVMRPVPRAANRNSDPGSDDLPEVAMDWDRAVAFCEKVTTLTGQPVRLPSEAEWEYACRAGSQTAYFFGDDPKDMGEYAWCCSASGGADRPTTLHPVGLKKPNRWGLCDMVGHVEQFCADEILAKPAPSNEPGSRDSFKLSPYRALRGSNCTQPADYARSARRVFVAGASRWIGFRVAVPIGSPFPPKPAPQRVVQAARPEFDPARTLTLDLGFDVSMQLIQIPTGEFMMGSPPTEMNRMRSESQFKVTFNKPFYMGIHPVTQLQYQAVMTAPPAWWNGRGPKGDTYPAVETLWKEAATFCERVTALSGRRVRLPSEAEWEYACRAGTQTAYFFGDDPVDIDEYGWCTSTDRIDGRLRTVHPVGSKKPNPWGLYDMVGHVGQFCSGWLGSGSSVEGAALEPPGPRDGLWRAVRGGTCISRVSECRAASRTESNDGANQWTGFRVVAEFDPLPAGSPLLGGPSNRQAFDPRKMLTLALGEQAKMTFIRIPPGTFLMGSPAGEKGRRDEETRHEVTLTKPFYLGICEVTQQQWAAVMHTFPWHGPPQPEESGPNFAAHYITWNDAGEFCRKLSALTGCTARLPTEAEWEYGCRAGKQTAFCFGDDPRRARAVDYMLALSHTLEPAGRRYPNEWGLRDMHGNIAEWCSDWYDPGYYSVSPKADPRGPATGTWRVLRGGSSHDGPEHCRSAARGGHPPDSGPGLAGLRVALEEPPPGWVCATRLDRPAAISTASRPPVPTAAKKAATQQELDPARTLTLDLKNGVTMKLVLIPPGKFMMGSPASDTIASQEERPQREVVLTRPFYMGIYTVTEEQYAAVTKGDPGRKKGSSFPVGQVSWNDADDFCAKASEMARRDVRLPSEAEWEYACRAGSETRFHFGDDRELLGDYSWRGAAGAYQRHPVGQKKPNAWGLYDMCGGGTEWCQDWFGFDYYKVGTTVDPPGPCGRGMRVIRGAAAREGWIQCRSAARSHAGLDGQNENLGFRVVVEPAPVGPGPDSGRGLDATSALYGRGSSARPTAVSSRPANGPRGTLTLDLGSGVAAELVLIPAGTFTMGAPPRPRITHIQGRPVTTYEGQEETPHEVRISRPFYMGIYEVTVEQYQAAGCKLPRRHGGPTAPVDGIRWDEAVDFCKRVTAKTGKNVRLATEAEWEFACRAGTKTLYNTGETMGRDQARYGGPDLQAPVAVGSFKPNAWGLYDMHGNVAEWCSDSYGLYPKGLVVDPTGPDKRATRRILRGGSCNDGVDGLRSAARCSLPASSPEAGMRIVVDTGPPGGHWAAIIAPTSRPDEDRPAPLTKPDHPKRF